MGELSISGQEIANRVYKGPAKTGDNVDGLVSLGYIWNGSAWIRDTGGGSGGGGTQYTDGDAAVTHPVGTIPIFNNAGTITAVSAANPLPVSATISTAGLATSTKQSDGSQKTQIVDGSGNVIASTSNALNTSTNITNSSLPVTGTVTANAGTNLNTSTLALETGGNLAAIKADVDKIPSQGQALAAASTPVVLPAAQVTTLTPPSNTGYALDATLTGGNQQVQGNVASAATDSGNPVKVGGKYNSTKPTFTDGQRGDLQLGTRGSVAVSLVVADSNVVQNYMVDNGDAVAASSTANKMAVIARTTVYNGTTWDLARSANGTSNTSGTGLMGSGQMVWDGTNWQKQKADTAGILTVNAQLYPISTALNTYSVHLTGNLTTTPTAATAYISSITISNEVGGTTSTITIQDKSATPLKLINGVATTALTTAPTVINFQTPVKMISGIDIITAGAVAATVDVWINYYQ